MVRAGIVACLLITRLAAGAEETVVIVSGANVVPVVYEPIERTDCRSLILPGKYEFYRYPGDGRGNSGSGVLVSKVEIEAVPGNGSVFSASETKVNAALAGFLQAPYIQLWQFDGCTLIFSKDPLRPIFVGSHSRVADQDRIFFYGFGGNMSELRRL